MVVFSDFGVYWFMVLPIPKAIEIALCNDIPDSGKKTPGNENNKNN
jgi:hypothetical protein